MSQLPAAIQGLSVLAPDYDALFCDIWGVVHNGIEAHAGAVDALCAYRAGGGHVILISNASRPGDKVIDMLDALSVSRQAYDGVVSSGDATRDLVRAYTGRTIHLVGPPTDTSLLAGLDVGTGPTQDAAAIVVTGLDDDGQTPDHYQQDIESWLDLGLPMICANPDKIVEIGDKLVYCAGALADIYAERGGEVRMAGKPYPPIYKAAMRKLEEAAGGLPDKSRILAIGDSVRTDARGAAMLGIDFLFITGSIHAAELDAFAGANPEAIAELVAPSGAKLVGFMPRLEW